MGIAALWDILKEGEVMPIAQIASNYLQEEGRPFRIAIDEASWRFKNLNAFQVAAIRENEAAANPVEKALFFRIIKLLKLNIHLIFVFDGPKRPWKRGKPSGRVDYENTRTFTQTLDTLKVPHHRAPGEAEAECARLQQSGIVDAVWSEDADALMFGATMLIRDHRVGNKKSDTLVRVHTTQRLRQEHGLCREAMVLFVMLNGGDYDSTGLHGCGPKSAMKVALWDGGSLARELCHQVDKTTVYFWRMRLTECLASLSIRLSIPVDFPNLKTLEKYRRPVVSTTDELFDLRGLRKGWDQKIDQGKLRRFMRERFNIWTKGYLKHIGPVLLAQELARDEATPDIRDNLYNVQLLASKRRKADDMAVNTAEKKITFTPWSLTTFDLSRAPPEEDWAQLATKAEPLFDPTASVECEILEFLLRKLPANVFQPPPTTPPKASSKKRKAAETTNIDIEKVLKTTKRSKASQLKAASAPAPSPRHGDFIDLSDDEDLPALDGWHFVQRSPPSVQIQSAEQRAGQAHAAATTALLLAPSIPRKVTNTTIVIDLT